MAFWKKNSGGAIPTPTVKTGLRQYETNLEGVASSPSPVNLNRVF